jgi:hypothetical protein
VGASGFDVFVEFAVSLSSFSAFLHGKGLSGLHQISHGLEQQVLALFEDETSHQIPPGTLGELSNRIEGLRVRVANFADSSKHPVAQRRAHFEPDVAAELHAIHHIWLLGSALEPWRDLAAQLDISAFTRVRLGQHAHGRQASHRADRRHRRPWTYVPQDSGPAPLFGHRPDRLICAPISRT